MKLFGWIKGRENETEKERRRWREAWAAAVDAEDVSPFASMKAELERFQTTPEADVEVELEMLDALDRLRTLRDETTGGALPLVETHHRIVSGEHCHFTAPVSLPDDSGQASGRLLFTAARSIFIGGGRPHPVPWHAVREVIQTERDVLLIRVDGTGAHFRFNTFADAVAAAFLARRLKGTKGTRAL